MSTLNIYGPQEFGSPYFIQGFRPLSFTNTTAVYGLGSARALTNDWVIEYTGLTPNQPGTITINTADLGYNGVYPLPISAITPESGSVFANVYAIGDSSGLNVPGLIIATAATGFVPSGYDVFAQVGIVQLNSSGNLLPYAMRGDYNSRWVMLQDAIQVLSAGAVVGPTAVSLAPLSLAWTGNVNLLYTFTANSDTDVATLIPSGLVSASKAPVEIKAAAAVAVSGNVIMPVGIDGVNPGVNYGLTSTSDSLSLWIAGFELVLPFV